MNWQSDSVLITLVNENVGIAAIGLSDLKANPSGLAYAKASRFRN